MHVRQRDKILYKRIDTALNNFRWLYSVRGSRSTVQMNSINGVDVRRNGVPFSANRRLPHVLDYHVSITEPSDAISTK